MRSMKPQGEHIVDFSGLKDGLHTFQWVVGDAFFKAHEEEEFAHGQVAVAVTMDKSTSMLVVNISAVGSVEVACDHCNAALDFPVNGTQRQIFQLNSTEEFDDEEMVALDASAHAVDLGQYIHECIRLALPIRRVHPPGQCDPEVDSALEHYRMGHEEDHDPDPRWEALRKLKQDKRA
jgi:uncharacterized protein